MPINADKPHLWKQDIAASVDQFNAWFRKFAPKAYRESRQETTKSVEQAMRLSRDWQDLNPGTLAAQPEILPVLRMATCPPLARDRLVGLAGVTKGLVNLVVGQDRLLNIPVDVVIQPKQLRPTRMPILIEAKSAGDFTNVNKRRKEEAIKAHQLRTKHGAQVEFILFLCGYFDTPYLGYEAAEGIDWIWEHRIEDLDRLGL